MNNADYEKQIGEYVYCNLNSTFPYQFVDKNGVVIGDPLPPISAKAAEDLQVKLVLVAKDELYVDSSGFNPVPEMKYFNLEKQMTDMLKQRILYCQRRKTIDVIVVDREVVEAAFNAHMKMDKFFMPLAQDPYRHRFYAYPIYGLCRSAMKNSDIIKTPGYYHMPKPRL